MNLLRRLFGHDLEGDVGDVRERQDEVDAKLAGATRAHREAERRLQLVETRVARIQRRA